MTILVLEMTRSSELIFVEVTDPNPVWFYNAACGHDIFLKGDMVKISTGLLGLLYLLLVWKKSGISSHDC